MGLYVISIGGPTRAGKSFTMNNMLTIIKSAGGKLHFGKFTDSALDESHTQGVNVALAEVIFSKKKTFNEKKKSKKKQNENVSKIEENLRQTEEKESGKLFLSLDCEGLGSLSKDMDPTLMIILSTISQ